MAADVTNTNGQASNHGDIVTLHPRYVLPQSPIENPPRNVLHDENGNFAVGNPGGPGRPPTKRISEAYKAILDIEGAEKYARVVADDALNAGKARDRLAAVQEMTDRIEGKAVQTNRHVGLFVMMPADQALAALDSWAEDE